MRYQDKIRFVTLLLGVLSYGLTAEERYLDNYEVQARLFGTAEKGQYIDHDLTSRTKAPYYFKQGHKSYSTLGFSYEYTDKKNGDFSVAYKPTAKKNIEKFGFMTDLWGNYPTLTEKSILKFYLKTHGLAGRYHKWSFQLIDSSRRLAKGEFELSQDDGHWQEISIPLQGLQKEDGFDINAIQMCEFLVNLPSEARVQFDFIRFENMDGLITGVTDKTLEQQILEDDRTKALRVQNAFEISAKKAHDPTVSAFAMLYLNKNLKEANRIIREDIQQNKDKDLWSLLRTPMYCRLYFWYSNRCGTYKGRLETSTEKLLLEAIWDRTIHKNDIHWSKKSTWWLDGSENHDLNAKACNLVSARIFMNEPEYKDRIYPNYGFGGGYHYGIAGYYGKGVDPRRRHGGGRANLSDGSKYTAKDQYLSWLKFIKEYFRERARYGFFVENSSSTYGKHTMNMIDLIHTYCGDSELKKIVNNFMTLYWSDYAQSGLSGISGGPKTRHHKNVGGHDCHKGMLAFLIGGPADAGIWNYWNIINGYELPKVIRSMIIDRDNMGRFVYQSRGIGEAEKNLPRPLGAERTLIINPQSRFLKYVQVTPHYTLGTQMDHPYAMHSHLSKAGRWHGMTVVHNPNTRIVPIAIPTEPDFRGKQKSLSMEMMYKSSQDKNTLIIQRSRSYFEANPDWFPLYKQASDQGLFIGKSWDEQLEKNGWIFLRKADVYAAIRVVLWDREYEKNKDKEKSSGTQMHFNSYDDDPTVKLADRPYSLSKSRDTILLQDKFSPMIIQAGDEEEFGSFETFVAETSNTPIALYKTVVPSFNILVITPPGENRYEMVFNASNNEIPTINGRPIHYEFEKTYSSPTMNSPYGSGEVSIEYGTSKLNLSF